MQLQVQAVHQAQGLELVFGQFATESPRHLAPEGGDALRHQRVIEFVVPVHCLAYLCSRGPLRPGRSLRTVGPAARIASRQSTGRRFPSASLTAIR